MSLWKAIRNDWEILGKRVAFVLRNGRRVRLWLYKWCSDMPLKDAFPSLFVIIVSKEAWVVKFWSGPFEGDSWAPRFLRPFNDWELEEMESFLLNLNGKIILNMK